MVKRHVTRLFASLAVASAAALAAASGAQAATIVALDKSGKSLSIINPISAKVTDTVKLKLGKNAKVVAMDLRVKNGLIYGITSKADVVTINPKTGKTKITGNLGFDSLPFNNFSMDCNPVLDLCRFVTEKERLNVVFDAAGEFTPWKAIKYADSRDKPRVVAMAYTNSFVGAETTELLDIDAGRDRLYRQDPPNDGTLVDIGPLVTKVEAPIAFDIASFDGRNTAYVIFKKTFYDLDLETGALAKGKAIKGLKTDVTDIVYID